MFFGVDLVLDEDGGFAVWSDRSGTWARAVDAGGRPLAERRRIGRACDGGLDAVRADDGAFVACLRRAVVEAGKPGHVALYRLDARLEVTARRALGEAGRYSLGVDVVVNGDVPVLAWHDGTPGAHRVWLAEAAEPPRDPRLVSRPGLAAGAPSVVVVDGRPVVAWAETWFDDDGYLVGQVLVSDLHGAPREVAVIIHDDARPVLGADAHGLLVAYRDEQPAGTRPRLFIRRLSDTLEPTGEPTLVGRADGEGRPTLLRCEGALTAVAPRSYGRSEVLVGINRFDDDLRRLGVERQIYEYAADFSLAAAGCAGAHTLVLVAERGHAARPVARLRTTTVDCR